MSFEAPFFEVEVENEQGDAITVPAIQLACNGVVVVAHAMNTRVRMFGDESLDHVEVSYGGQLYGVMNTDENEIVDLLVSADFPSVFQPVPDEDTIDWFVGCEPDIDAEIRGQEWLQ